MGTSTSSRGSPSRVPIVPPWVPPAPPLEDQDIDGDEAEQKPSNTPGSPTIPPPVAIAPPGRFSLSRSNLGQYARNGSQDAMRSGLGYYIKKGLGGASTALHRFGGTAKTAGTLYGALSSVATGQAAASNQPYPLFLTGRTADEIIDAVIEVVRPLDGTQDAEANRKAIKDALAELLTRFPEADLMNLAEDQRLYVIERYIAVDVYNRFHLDVGKTIQDKAPTVTTALARLKEVKDYIKQTVSAAFRKARTIGESLNVGRITQMVTRTLSETFQVFEDYVR